MRSSASLLLFALALGACIGSGSRALAAAASPGASDDASYQSTGLASWYGDEVAGNRTASGDRFDPAGITAAHRSLPLNSFAEVTDIDSGRSVIVRINDRGPGRQDRVIDLSRGAAQQLGFGRRSVARVSVRAYIPTALEAAAMLAGKAAAGSAVQAGYRPGYPPAMPVLDAARSYHLQVASFSNRARAVALAARLGASVVSAGSLYRVRIGPLVAKEVEHARDVVTSRGYGDVQILPAD
ncbi:MAG: septal ring lytic transglycosylase RlpA family protein [Sphingomonas bacterium]|nr:septal ring lytic transglycosylase RlpA family protein [Sphingomonas bacterium]